MRGVSQAVRDALWDASGLLRKWDLFTLYKPDGTVWVRWTSATANVAVGETTWTGTATAPTISVTGGVSDVGLTVDTRDIELGGDVTLDGKTLKVLCLDGSFDDARVVWERAYATSGAIVDKVERFDGVVVDAQPWSTGVRLRVKSRVAELEQEMASRPIGVACPWGFGTTECGHTKLAGETCAHTTTACLGFSNITNFGGFHLTPPAGTGS